MAYPETTYDVNTPDGSDNPTEGDNEIRLVKASIQERLNLEHVWDKSGSEVSGPNTGKHTNITTLSIVNAGTLTNAGLATLQSLKLAAGATAVEISTDGTLADDADTVVVTEKAIKTYVDTAIAALVDFSGAVSIFGTRQEGLAKDVTYEAPTDGYIYFYEVNQTGSGAWLWCYAGTNQTLVDNADTSVKRFQMSQGNDSAYRFAGTVPVKKGEFVRVEATLAAPVVQWIPIGVGELAVP